MNTSNKSDVEQPKYQLARFSPSKNANALFCVPKIVSNLQSKPEVHLPQAEGAHMIYFKDGKGTLLAGGDEVPVQAGDFVLLPESDYCDTRFDGNLIWCVFIGEPAKNLCRQLSKRFGYVYHLSKNSPIPYAVQFLAHEMRQPSPREGLLCCILTEILCAIYDNAIHSIDTDITSASVKQAQLYIRNHFDEKIRPSDVAKEVSMSLSYFNKIFKKEMELTLREYIGKVRIEMAQALLFYTEKSVHQISVELGYSSDAEFVKRFKKYSGVTPSQFRLQSVFHSAEHKKSGR